VTAPLPSTLDFELPNAGAGPDPLVLSLLADDHEFVLLLFQRDYHCTNCRSQVQAVNDRYDEFEARNTAVVSIVPEPPDRLADWQESYGLSFPLCADLDATVSDAYGQPVRFGILGSLSDFLGRMPEAVLLDCRDAEPTITYDYEGSSTWDRPSIEELLRAIDDRR